MRQAPFETYWNLLKTSAGRRFGCARHHVKHTGTCSQRQQADVLDAPGTIWNILEPAQHAWRQTFWMRQGRNKQFRSHLGPRGPVGPRTLETSSFEAISALADRSARRRSTRAVSKPCRPSWTGRPADARNEQFRSHVGPRGRSRACRFASALTSIAPLTNTGMTSNDPLTYIHVTSTGPLACTQVTSSGPLADTQMTSTGPLAYTQNGSAHGHMLRIHACRRFRSFAMHASAHPYA